MEHFQEFVINHPWLWGGFVLALIALAVNEWFINNHGQRPLSASEAVHMMNTDDAVVVDTRSASDYKKNHILNAVHVPAAGIDSRANEISKNTDRAIICYCASGNAASQAADKLRKQGYTNVHALKGGINAWQSDGLPLTSK